MKKVLLIDGNSLLFRAYYATSYTGNIMHTKDGVFTNAIFALSNMINKILEESYDYYLVAFDASSKTFRHAKYEDYKANRIKAPDELKMQFPLAREMISKMGIKWFEIEGYEADDIIGTLAKESSRLGYKVNVFSSDRDLLQLVDDNINVIIPLKGVSEIVKVSNENIVEFYGVRANQVVDYKGLRGDSSDNIKGIDGVGEKTAIKLLQDYNSIEGIYENIDSVKGKLKDKLILGKEDAFASKELATIYTSVELPFSINDCVKTNQNDKLIEFYKRYEMVSLIKKLEIKDESINYKIVTSLEDSFLSKKLYVYPNIDGSNYHKANLLGISFSDGENTFYLERKDLFNDKIITYLVNDNNKIVYDLKALKIIFAREKYLVNGLDFKIAINLLNCNLKEDIDSIFNSYGFILPNLKEDSVRYSCSVSYYMSKIFDGVLDKLKEYELEDLYYNIELPLVDVLTRMEDNGIVIDKDELDSLGVEYRFKLNNLESEIIRLAGIDFNISSPKQVGEILFDRLGLTANKKRSTSSEELEKISFEHEIVDLILEYRKYSKLLSTYVEGLKNYIYEDGLIHAIFNQTQTQTGRLSSSEPNMQNISVRDEESRLIRKAFKSRFNEGKILSLDYSQVELRVLASLANDKHLIDSFNNHEDIHTVTASKVFNLPLELVTSDLRRKAKAINFGIVYGISDWGLASQVKVSVKEAKEIIDKYFETYPSVKEYLDSLVEYCKENGYVKTLYKRRREVKEINSSSYLEKEAGKRIAMNTPIQGTSADIIKIAMIKIDEYIKKNNVKSKMIMQIHDELVFDLASDEMYLIEVFKNIMEEASNLMVKLEVNYGIGSNWYLAK